MYYYMMVAARLMLGILLTVGGLTKCLRFKWFKRVLAEYKLTPQSMARAMATCIVLLEFLIGCILLTGRWAPWPAYAAMGLLALFTGAVGVNLIRGRFNMECGCNSFWGKSRIGWQILVRNIGLGVLAILASPPEAWARKPIYTGLFVIALAMIIAPFFLTYVCHTRTTAPLQPN